MAAEIYCPVCKSESEVLYALDEKFLKTSLEKHFHTAIVENLDIIQYEIARCPYCTLSFAYPQQEGSKAFYSWITRQKDYYPNDRWEYHQLSDILKRNTASAAVLDVGCGSGEFLERLKALGNVEGVGVDPTYASVQECKARSVNAYCMDLNQFLTEQSDYRRYFDYVVSFHCLEHIGDPVAFLSLIVQALKQSGSIFMSTPYSPMSMEIDWFDPLNHPPHHMGRWNEKAYRELGKQLNLSVEFHMPEAAPLVKRTVRSFLFSSIGMHSMNPKRSTIALILRKFPSFLKHLVKQSRREKINKRTAADVVLVEFKMK